VWRRAKDGLQDGQPRLVVVRSERVPGQGPSLEFTLIVPSNRDESRVGVRVGLAGPEQIFRRVDLEQDRQRIEARLRHLVEEEHVLRVLRVLR
jgi:hypothetical protein